MSILLNIDVPDIKEAAAFYQAALGLTLRRVLDGDVASASSGLQKGNIDNTRSYLICRAQASIIIMLVEAGLGFTMSLFIDEHR